MRPPSLLERVLRGPRTLLQKGASNPSLTEDTCHSGEHVRGRANVSLVSVAGPTAKSLDQVIRNARGCYSSMENGKLKMGIEWEMGIEIVSFESTSC